MLFKKLDAVRVIITISFVITYLISDTIAGFLTAIYARWLGDDTAEDAGFVSLNPLQHIDILGFFLLILFQFGWGRSVPINGSNIYGPYRTLKLSTLFFFRAFIHFILATLSFLALSVFFSEILVSTSTSFEEIAHNAAGLTPFMLSIVLLLIIFVYYNLFRSVICLLVDGLRFLLLIGAEEGYSYMEYADFLFLWGPLIFIIFFADPIKEILFYLIGYLVSFIVGSGG